MIDLLIFFLIALFTVLQSRTKSNVPAIIGLICLLFSLVVGLAFYLPLASLLSFALPLSPGVINVIALCTIIVIANIGAMKIMIATHTEFIEGNELVWDKYTRPIVGAFEGIVLLSFLLAIEAALPLHPLIKNQITSSPLAATLIEQTQEMEIAIQNSFGRATNETLDFLTTKPLRDIATNSHIQGAKTIDNVRKLDTLTPDRYSELQMLRLIANARSEYGLPQLTFRQELVPIARGHAIDMWERKYIGHISPEGKSPVDRLKESHIPFLLVGENIALSSSVTTAEIGLINSSEHRANILDPGYTHIGIGVIDNGAQGKIFVQIFTK